jgi:GR25 family glycosyltransferase involved in LPS biosynthesis
MDKVIYLILNKKNDFDDNFNINILLKNNHINYIFVDINKIDKIYYNKKDKTIYVKDKKDKLKYSLYWIYKQKKYDYVYVINNNDNIIDTTYDKISNYKFYADNFKNEKKINYPIDNYIIDKKCIKILLLSIDKIKITNKLISKLFVDYKIFLNKSKKNTYNIEKNDINKLNIEQTELIKINTNNNIKKNKILYIVLCCDNKPIYINNQKRIIEMLENAKVDYLCLKGNSESIIYNEESKTLFVDVIDIYENLPIKIYKSYEWIYNNTDYEYVYKIDDDFVFTEKNKSFNEMYDYYGNILVKNLDRKWHFRKCSNNELNNLEYAGKFIAPYAAGGHGYILSRKSLEILINNKESFYNKYEFYEDKIVGDILYKNKIFVVNNDNKNNDNKNNDNKNNDNKNNDNKNNDNKNNDNNYLITYNLKKDNYIMVKNDKLSKINNNKYATINIKGGIGNILFEVCMLLSFCINNKYKLYLNLEEINESNKIKKLFKNINYENNKIKFKIYKENNFYYEQINLKDNNDNIRFDGYFQSYKYFYNNFEKIKKTFMNIIDVSNIYNKLYKKYNMPTVAIHIRRGDYLTITHIYEILNKNYYWSAINLFDIKSHHFIIFHQVGDDISDLGFEELPNKTIITNEYDDITTLYLMAECDNNIIANSTYSLWALYLSKNLIKKKKVIPNYWFIKKSQIKFELFDIFLIDNNTIMINNRENDFNIMIDPYKKKEIIYRIQKNNLFITMLNLGKYGRLGNQMFQYAILLKFSYLYNYKIKIPIYDENFICPENTTNKHKTVIQNYFNLNYEKLTDQEINYTTINEKSFSYDNSIFYLENFNNLNINGYFQSYKYFDDIKDIIYENYKFNINLYSNCEEYILSLKNEHNLPVVGIHIRCGDLLNYNAYGPPMNYNYIKNAVGYLNSTIGELVVVFISENNDWVKENILKYIDISNNRIYFSNNSEDFDLCLLTLCDHLILSNSSFSWWGAYLNKKENKKIIIKSIKNNNYFFDYIVPNEQRQDLIPPEWIQIEDTFEDEIYNIIYSTIYDKEQSLSIKKIDLIKEIIIENKQFLKNQYDFGIVMPTYNRPDYLKYTLQSLKISNTSVFDIIFILFDDGSENINTIELLKNFNLENVPIIKIYTNRLKLVKSKEGMNTLLPGSCYPYSIKFGYEFIFRLNSKYAINLDSDAMVNHDWLLSINNFTSKFNLNDRFILSGFRSDGTTHKIIEECADYYIQNGFGGINIIFNKKTFYEIIYNQIYDHAYDWYTMRVCEKENVKIYLLKPSIVQHIGFNTSIIRGIENVKSYNHDNYIQSDIFKYSNTDTNIDTINYDILLELDNTSKKSIDFPFSCDFKLLRNKTIIDDVVDKTFIINIKSRLDRWNKISKYLFDYNITNIERFDAVVPQIINNSDIDFKNFINTKHTDIKFLKDYDISAYKNLAFEWVKCNSSGINYLRGMVGCKASHVEIIKLAKKRNYKSILILEDDIKFINKWEKHLSKTIKVIKEQNIEWDILYLTANHVKPYQQINKYLVKINYAFQAAGYIINENCYDFIIDNAMKSGREIDVFYAEEIQNNSSFKVYGISPNIINQEENFSSIENKIVKYTINTNMFTNIKFDIVYVCHSKDKDIIKKSLESVRKYVRHFNNIYLVSKENLLHELWNDNMIYVDENKYPFSKNDIINNLPKECPSFRYGWFYQQLLKLYIYRIIPEITDYFMVLDSDVIFLKFIRFFNDNNKPYFTTGDEYNKPYFKHMKILYPKLKKMHPKSGIAHHMIFNKKILDKLFFEVEKIHGEPFWKVFLNKVKFDKSENYSRASEYEIYFNYVLKYFPKKYEIRNLIWFNLKFIDIEKYKKNHDIDYVGVQDYLLNDPTKYNIE